ncbi:DMT family transporter [Arthrobacter sp. NPDC057388]|jgi:drug/metabolite transporter (DMT)-like permease|uniref:DMT family transporter n=1 Tax=Arthrobacter sp. NPDC057388 TaxID=3346116 RepID=UPI00362A8C38
MTLAAATTTKRARRRALTVAVASLLGATLFWAGNYIVGAGAVESIDPLSLVLLRWSLALLPLLAIAQIAERPQWRQVLAAWPWLLALSMFGLLGYNLLLYTALEHTDAFSASLINAFNPALITLAAAAFLRERLTRRAVGGVLIALAGVLLVLSNGDAGKLLQAGFGTGELFMIGAIAAWSAYTITGRLAPPLPPITATAVQAAITVVVLTPLSLAGGGPSLPSPPDAVASLVFIALFPSVLSYLLWNRALTVIPAGTAGVFLNLITVFTALFTILAGHPYSIAQIAGGAVVIAGILLTSARSQRGRSMPFSWRRRQPGNLEA